MWFNILLKMRRLCLSRRSRNKHRIKVFTLLLAFTLVFTFFYSGGAEVFRILNKPDSVHLRSGESDFVTVFDSVHWRNSTGKRIILLWTAFRGEDNWMNYRSRTVGNCESRCFVTSDRKYLKEADAVLFHLGDLQPWTRMPPSRQPFQKWVVYNSDPPPYQSWTMLGLWNNLFNWTLWYRSDATVLASFGGFSEMPDDDKHAFNKHFRFRNYAEGKSKLVSMVMDNCYDDARRYKIVRDLKRYINIDAYGACGEKTCRTGKDCDLRLADYAFHLTLEKAHCRDFITEQYWNALRRKQIPIVNILPPIKNILLPNSYINLLDYSNMTELAEYLNEVAKNPKLFNAFFEWEKRYSISCGRRFSCLWCALCDALEDRYRHAQVYTDLEGWVKNDYCHKWTIPQSLRRYLDRFLYDIGVS